RLNLGSRPGQGRQQRSPCQPEKPESSQQNPWASSRTAGVRSGPARPLVSNAVEVGTARSHEIWRISPLAKGLCCQEVRGLRLKQKSCGSPSLTLLELFAGNRTTSCGKHLKPLVSAGHCDS